MIDCKELLDATVVDVKFHIAQGSKTHIPDKLILILKNGECATVEPLYYEGLFVFKPEKENDNV